MSKNISFTICLFMGTHIRSTRYLFMSINICSTRCLFMCKSIRSNIIFLDVKGNSLQTTYDFTTYWNILLYL